MKAFFSVLAVPLAAGLALALCVTLLDPRGPLVALMLNVFLLVEVGGVGGINGSRCRQVASPQERWTVDGSTSVSA